MRQIGTLPDASQAQTLADYLLTQHIETRLDEEAGGCTIWVCDEDKVPQARQELADFLRNPADSRYTAAVRAARALRQQEDRQEEEYRSRQVDLREKLNEPPARGGRSITALLLTLSVLVALVTRLGEEKEPWIRVLSITTIPTPRSPATLTLPEQLATGEVWRLVTPIFIHFGLLHLLFNMLWLVVLGADVEERRGPWRYLLLVLLIAVTSNVAQYYWGGIHWQGGRLALRTPNPNFGGMSGVVYGLFGYVWMKSRLEPELGLTISPTNVILLLVWFLLCLSSTFIENVANVAHAVGLGVGILVGVLPYLWRRRLKP